MLRFVLQKLINKKWVVSCLLIGITLLIAITASNPLYTNGVMQKTLSSTLRNAVEVDGKYPSRIEYGMSFTGTGNPESLANAMTFYDMVYQQATHTGEQFNLPVAESSFQSYTAPYNASPKGDGDRNASKQFKLGCFHELDDKIEIISGEMYSDSLSSDGYIEVIISEQMHLQQDLFVDDTYTFDRLTTLGKPVKFRVVGIFTSAPGSELYWSQASTVLSLNLLMAPSIFEEYFCCDYEATVSHQWMVYLDYTAIRTDDVDSILSFCKNLENEYSEKSYISAKAPIINYLESYKKQSSSLEMTLLVLQTPIFVLLGAFIFMVSRQMLEMDQNEIALMKSRGARKKQILQIYLLQGAILSFSGLALGLPLSFPLCQLLGSSNAFLEFVQRTALPLRLTLKTVIFALIGALVSCAAMVIPAVSYSKLSIVSHKVNKQRRNKAPFWQRIFLDFILLGVSLYAYYSFQNQKEFLMQQMANGGKLDPLLYLSSSIFSVAVGLIGIRLLPLLTSLIFMIGKKLWSPSLYVAFRRILRQHNSSNFIMLFLVLTISLGIFNANTARSINANSEEEITYLAGSDVVVQEIWEESTNSKTGHTSFVEPNFDKYYGIEGIEKLTKVIRLPESSMRKPDSSGIIEHISVMGIHTKEFGETANFDASLMPVHWYYYLNAISQNSNAVLVSSNFKDLGFSIGDSVRYYDAYGNSYHGTVFAFVDYWPSYEPTVKGEPNYLIIAHNSYLQSVGGVLPYQIWMKVTDSTQPIYDFATENRITFQTFVDTSANIIELKNNPTFQGTNGILTSNFIIVLLLCTVGFLIFWILSIQSRVLQFGIFRAMGISMREIVTMLIGEQILITGSSIGFGILAGKISTMLFMPLIQLAYGNGQYIPLETVSKLSDSLWLFGTVGAMILLCMIIMSTLIARIKITTALKLGED